MLVAHALYRGRGSGEGLVEAILMLLPPLAAWPLSLTQR
jgi:hypothetical protein